MGSWFGSYHYPGCFVFQTIKGIKAGRFIFWGNSKSITDKDIMFAEMMEDDDD